MIYFIETVSGAASREDLDNLIRIIKIGFSNNFKKRIKAYYTTSNAFKVIKTLDGKDFDQKCETILHRHFSSKRFPGTREFFIKDEELMREINKINTVDDIIRLRKSYCSKLEHLKFQKKFKGILTMNWNIIKTVCNEDIDFVIDYILTKENYIKVEDINIFKSVKDLFGVDILDYPEEVKGCVDDFFNIYNKIDTRQKKLKFLCEKLPTLNELERTCILGSITETRFQEYIEVLGLDECKAQAYNTSFLNKKLNIVGFDETLLNDTIYNEFKVGHSYSNPYIKQKLGEIYKDNNYRATAKAVDLNKFFNTKHGRIVKDKTGKWVNGICILSKKTDNVEFDKEKLKDDIYNEFIVGNSYSTSYVKQKLGEIYSQRNYGTTAKSVDLDEFFNTKRKSVKDETGKWINGISIVSKK